MGFKVYKCKLPSLFKNSICSIIPCVESMIMRLQGRRGNFMSLVYLSKEKYSKYQC